MRAYSPVVYDDGSVKAEFCEGCSFDTLVCLKIEEADGGEFTAADYGSCGKTLDSDSIMTAWLPLVKWWNDNIPAEAVFEYNGKYLSIEEDGRVTLSGSPCVLEIKNLGGGLCQIYKYGKVLTLGSSGLAADNGAGVVFRIISDMKGGWLLGARACFAAADAPGLWSQRGTGWNILSK